jgi:diguanylate cyclase (GGDEF)-like protein/PAS domain S-box-containing protein
MSPGLFDPPGGAQGKSLIRSGFPAMLLAASLSFLICLASGILKQWWGEVAPIWVANGVLVAQAMVVTSKRTRMLVLGGGMLGFLGANLYVGESLYVSSCFTAADMVEVVIALLLGPRALSAAELIRPRAGLRFVLGAVIAAPVISGLVAMSLLDGWSTVHPFSSLGNWVLSDALGVAIFVPSALIFFSGEMLDLFRSEKRLRAIGLLSALGVITLAVFGQNKIVAMYWILPPIAWLAFEIELAGVLLGVLITIALAIFLTLNRLGPLWLLPYPDNHDRILTLQVLMLAAIAVAFPISVMQSERNRLMRLLRAGEQRYRMLAEHSDDVVMELALDGTVQYASPRLVFSLGHEPQSMVGRSALELADPRDRPLVQAAIDLAIRRRGESSLEFRARRDNGSVFWAEGFFSMLPQLSRHAQPALAFMLRNVHRKKEQEATREERQTQLERLAYLDELSGLHNRRYFDEQLARRLARVAGEHTVTLLLIDVDHFKAFNDLYGHVCGDACLRSVAAALREAAHEADVVARFGGEEFAVIVEEGESALRLAQHIRARIEALAIPHAASDAGVVTLSIGMADTRTYPTSDPRMLLTLADERLYHAKRAGRNRIASLEGLSF